MRSFKCRVSMSWTRLIFIEYKYNYILDVFLDLWYKFPTSWLRWENFNNIQIRYLKLEEEAWSVNKNNEFFKSLKLSFAKIYPTGVL